MSGYLVDTNVVSETTRAQPEPRVMTWLYSVPRSTVLISTRWATQDLPEWFAGRIRIVDLDVASLWGRLTGVAAAEGKTIPAIDGLLAATAIHRGLTLVTRNTPDVNSTGVQLLNTWL